MRLTSNFTVDEFECPCCGKKTINTPFVHRLQVAREIASVPFVINSGYRCPEHNRAIGGKEDSSHPKGVAADIRARTPWERFSITNGLMKAGFERIGMGRDFIHVDMDIGKRQSQMWVY